MESENKITKSTAYLIGLSDALGIYVNENSTPARLIENLSKKTDEINELFINMLHCFFENFSELCGETEEKEKNYEMLKEMYNTDMKAKASLEIEIQRLKDENELLKERIVELNTENKAYTKQDHESKFDGIKRFLGRNGK